MGADGTGEYDQSFVQFRTGEHLGFSFGHKHSAFARAALSLMPQAAFADFKSDKPSRHRDTWSTNDTAMRHVVVPMGFDLRQIMTQRFGTTFEFPTSCGPMR